MQRDIGMSTTRGQQNKLVKGGTKKVSLKSIGRVMSEQYCTTKGLGWAFLTCAFLIVGVPVLMWLALEGSSWYETFSMMNPMW